MYGVCTLWMERRQTVDRDLNLPTGAGNSSVIRIRLLLLLLRRSATIPKWKWIDKKNLSRRLELCLLSTPSIDIYIPTFILIFMTQALTVKNTEKVRERDGGTFQMHRTRTRIASRRRRSRDGGWEIKKGRLRRMGDGYRITIKM